MTSTPAAPAGLKYSRGYRTRFWLRPDSMSFRRLFAVHFMPMPDGIHRNVFSVSGFLGAFAFEWQNPTHARKLLVHNSTGKHSRQLLGTLIDESCGEWLLCNQLDGTAAASCSDADYVAQRCLHMQAITGNSGVYFITNGRNAVKIGKSGSCISHRFVSLQIANPDALRVVAAIADPDPSALESRLHAMLDAKRIRGEWFSLTDAEAIEIAVTHGGRAIDFLPR